MKWKITENNQFVTKTLALALPILQLYVASSFEITKYRHQCYKMHECWRENFMSKCAIKVKILAHIMFSQFIWSFDKFYEPISFSHLNNHLKLSTNKRMHGWISLHVKCYSFIWIVTTKNEYNDKIPQINYYLK